MRYLQDHDVTAECLFDALSCGAALIDENGVIGDLNERLANFAGYQVSDLIGRDANYLVATRERSANVLAIWDHHADVGPPPTTIEEHLSILCRDGYEVPANVTFSRLTIDDRPWTIMELHDCGAEEPRRTAEGPSRESPPNLAASLAASEQRFRLAFEGSMAPMVFSDRNGIFLAVNSAFCRMSGRTKEELIGHDSKHFTYPEDVGISEEAYRLITSGQMDDYRYGKRFLHKNGRVVVAEVSICSARDENGAAAYFVSSVRDVTEERALAAQLSFQALHDPLTGLANRALFDDRLAQARARCAREERLGAVLLLDLDDFKEVNDTYGHLVGDQLLIEIADRFRRVTRSIDTLCRFGGDEFLYLAEGLNTHAESELIAQRLLQTLDESFTFDQVTLQQRASVGVVVWEGEGPDNVQLVQNADVAMYEAKRLGHGHITVFTSQIGHEAVNRFAMVQELRHALSHGEVVMHYQPIVDLTSSAVVGFEALMRWQHPTRGWIPPDVFIPLAEQSELIMDLGTFALHEAVTAASTWAVTDAAAGYPCVTVNFSAKQFHDPDLVSKIEREIRGSGIQPHRLILEVTENVALVDVAETMNIIEKLNRLHVGIALDDFGKGYSSLSYLAALNPRIIKIDQSFVRPQHDKKRSDNLLEAIVTLGNKLNMTVLAEGIETLAQLDRLHHLDCDLGQGFLWSPAVPVEEAMDMLATLRDD